MTRAKEGVISKRKKAVLNSLRKLGLRVYNQLKRGEYPWIKMPSRSVDNIYYDEQLKQYVLGSKTVRRDCRNVKHLRPFTQLMWVAYFVNSLIEQGKSSTLRDVFYNAQAYGILFEEQMESNNIITDLETIIGFTREDFHVFPEERSSIFGDLIVEYTVPGYEGKRLNLTIHPDGVMIGPALTSAEFIETDAEIVIAVEKGAMFTRFIEEKVHEKFKAILIHTAGQAPRATRRLIHRLNEELKLPVYIFTDADPWGMHIAQVIISGSANAAHVKEIVTPSAKWAGVWATDITRYKLPTDKLSDIDIKRLHELEKDPRYKGELWRREIAYFLKIKRKSEQEAFSRYGLSYIVDRYLPEKLEEVKSY